MGSETAHKVPMAHASLIQPHGSPSLASVLPATRWRAYCAEDGTHSQARWQTQTRRYSLNVG